MAKKIKYGLATLSFLLCFAAATLVLAADDEGGEGYAPVTYRDFSHTMAMLGGADMDNTDVADDYAKILHCNLYQKNYKNDLEWHKIRNQIVAHVKDRKDYYRVLYETTSPFRLGRYDVEGQFFPLSPDTAIVNVGSLSLLTVNEAEATCGFRKPSNAFPWNMNLVLEKPLTLNTFKLPMNEVEKMLVRMTKIKNMERTLYGRIRFRVTGAKGLVYFKERVIRSELRGEITGIDFFLDRAMTQPIGKSQLYK